MQITASETYKGFLELGSNGEEFDLLSVREGRGSFLLAEEIAQDMEDFGCYLSIRYWLSDRSRSKEELIESFAATICGAGEAEYSVAYSECTGYLWTTENLVAGGHDLLAELKESIGSYLYMEIDYSRSPYPGET